MYTLRDLGKKKIDSIFIPSATDENNKDNFINFNLVGPFSKKDKYSICVSGKEKNFYEMLFNNLSKERSEYLMKNYRMIMGFFIEEKL